MQNYSAEYILAAADELNTRPRKKLNYATPEELFDAFLDSISRACCVEDKSGLRRTDFIHMVYPTCTCNLRSENNTKKQQNTQKNHIFLLQGCIYTAVVLY